MRPLRTGQGRRQERWASRAAGLYLHLQVLAAELHASSPMKSPTPVTPEERSRSHSERMEQQSTRLWELVRCEVTRDRGMCLAQLCVVATVASVAKRAIGNCGLD